MFKEAAARPGNYWYIFPTTRAAKRALWQQVDPHTGFKLLDHCPKEFLVKEPTDMDMKMTFKNGSTIQFVGVDDNPEALRGISAAGAVFSEFAFSDPQVYLNMIPSLRQAGAWLIINSTPNGRNHFYDMYCKVKKASGWYVSHLQCLWPDKENYDNTMTQDEVKAAIEEDMMPEDEAEREYGTSFSTASKGSYYADNLEQARLDGRMGLFEYNDLIPVDTYWDLGHSDDTVIWFGQTIDDRVIFIDYIEDSRKDLKQYIDMLDQKGYNYGMHVLPHDADHNHLQNKVPLRRDFESYLKAYKLKGQVICMPKTQSVQGDIYTVRGRFKNYYFNEVNCADGIRKLELYKRAFNKITQTYSERPAKDGNDHCADAFRMEAASSAYRRSKAQFDPRIKTKVIQEFDWTW